MIQQKKQFYVCNWVTSFCCPSVEPSEKKKKMILGIFFHVWKNLSKEIFFVCRTNWNLFFSLNGTEWKKLFSEKCHDKKFYFFCVQPN